MGKAQVLPRRHGNGARKERAHKQRQDRRTKPDSAPDFGAKIHDAVKHAKKAAHKAKTFEIQRLIKRLKAAKTSNSDDVSDLEAQLSALKKLSHDSMGYTALLSKIKKDRALSTNPEVATALSTLKVPPDTTSSSKDEEVVRSRVLSNKSLALEIQKTLDKLHGKTKGGIEEPDDAGDEDANMDDTGDDREDRVDSKATDGADESDLENEEELVGAGDGVVENDDLASNAGWESGSVDDTGHVGGHSDDDASDTEAEEGAEGSSMDEDEAEEVSADDSDDVEPSSHKSKAKAKASGGDGSSMFLPSLSVGFARGDDDDWSDGEAKAADGVRKNRRGQRARQAIWEKKYGRGAKHVIQRQQQDAISNAYATRGSGRGGAASRGGGRGLPRGEGRGGSFSARGISGPERGRGRGGSHSGRGAPSSFRGGAPSTRPSPGQGSNSIPVARTVPPKPKVDNKPVHPSWEAKQKQKSAAAIIPSQGKKIVF